MKVTFDSNVWRKVTTPENFPKDPEIEHYKIIHDAINSKQIEAFLSETVFTLEAIKRDERKSFFRAYRPKIRIIEDEKSNNPDGMMHITMSIGPNEDAHPGNNDFLKEHFSDAEKLGFKIIHVPRIASVVNKDIENARYKHKEGELGNYLDKVFEVEKRINALEAGNYEIQQIGLKYDESSWFVGVGKAPDSEDSIIAKAIAEWADGDSIAAHIAINGDYFCTNDLAIKGGPNSVLSAKNLEILGKEYGLKIKTPKELSELLM